MYFIMYFPSPFYGGERKREGQWGPFPLFASFRLVFLFRFLRFLRLLLLLYISLDEARRK